jgi:hypothetical protein
MSEGREAPFRYSYKVRTQPEWAERVPAGAVYDSLLSIRDTVDLLTSDCEVADGPDGLHCEKHARPVGAGGSRCDYLATRFVASTEEQKGKIQQYVNDILGVKDPKLVKRLTG